MKINFTKKEYLLLLDMLYLSDWVMHSHKVEDDNNEYKALRKKILLHSKEMGAEQCIEYEAKSDEYFESASYETELHEKFLEPYNEETFWTELSDRLGKRDVLHQMSFEQLEEMDWIERAKIIDEASSVYEDEFSQNGLDNIKIVKDKTRIN